MKFLKIVRLKNSLWIFLVFLGLSAFAQDKPFNNYREIGNLKPQWYQITLPNNIYGKVNPDFSDFRILGVEINGDTIEAPYLLKVLADDYVSKKVEFKLINKVNNANGYYYTFEVGGNEPINQMELKFLKANFDWLVDLEGSNNQIEWFKVLSKKRIVSIKNDYTSYTHSTLHFGDLKYRYFRLHIPALKSPQFSTAALYKNEIVKGKKNEAEVIENSIEENEALAQTEITIQLKEPVPISRVILNTKDTIDFYRPIRISYLRDSVQTEQGWKYVWGTLKSGVLSSLEPSEFIFSTTIAQKLRVIISNGDNEPLDLSQVSVSGDVHQLIVRVSTQANYFLVYGNKKAHVPNYDISRFSAQIPSNPKILKLGAEEKVAIQNDDLPSELFENSWWMWSIMVFIILILGWFSFKMIRS